MYYVYILISLTNNEYYVGSSEDLKSRFKAHNNGLVKTTKGNLPYELAWHCVFNDKQKAIQFEKYLKQGSGFAFRNKHLV